MALAMPDDDRQAEADEMAGHGRRRQYRARISADREEAAHTRVEKPAIPPLQIEAERHHRIDAADGEERDRVFAIAEERAHSKDRPRNRPCGRHRSIPTMIAKATPVL